VGVDVYPNEPAVNPRLLTFSNVTLLPHMGTETKETQMVMEARALKNLWDYFTEGRGNDLVTEYMMTPKL
jgi:lactate dehydrogenase-like 2-hydroxyacid dehydrogenase